MTEMRESRTARIPTYAPTVVGGLVATGLGFAVALTTDTEVVLGIAIGLLGTILSLQLEAYVREERHREEAEPLLASLAKAPWLLPEFRDIARAIEEADRRTAALFSDAAKQQLTSIKDDIRRLSSGQLRTQSADIAGLITLIDATKQSIKATSFERTEADFWSSARGRAYWEANRRALDRGVAIQRVFIDGSGLLDDALREQTDAGVEVRVASQDVLDDDLCVHLLVLDDQITQEIEVSVSGKVLRYAYSDSGAEVRRALDRFNRVLAQSHTWSARAPQAPST